MTVKELIGYHIGGIADLGDDQAKYCVPHAEDYDEYRERMKPYLNYHSRNKMLTLYRCCHPDELTDGSLDYSSDSGNKMMSTSTSKSTARSFCGIAKHLLDDVKRVVVKMYVHIGDVVFMVPGAEEEIVTRKPMSWELVESFDEATAILEEELED